MSVTTAPGMDAETFERAALAAAPIIEARSGLLINPFAFSSVALILLPVLIVLASLVGFIPAMTAYRTDVASTLSDT